MDNRETNYPPTSPTNGRGIRDRNAFKYIFSNAQIYALEEYFKINKIPKRKEKLQLAENIDADPIHLNKWFQAKRNRERKYNTFIPKYKT
jgi:hypothetical protein